MILTDELINKYNSVKEHGDQKKLMKITGIKSHSNMSSIMNGKLEVTICRYAKIKKFVESREKQIKALTEDGN